MSEELICPICESKIVANHSISRWRFGCESCQADFLFSNSKFKTESDAITAFKKATRADKQGINWVSVKERLPNENKKYFVTNGKDTDTAIFDTDQNIFYLYSLTKRITHWAEINLPKGE